MGPHALALTSFAARAAHGALYGAVSEQPAQKGIQNPDGHTMHQAQQPLVIHTDHTNVALSTKQALVPSPEKSDHAHPQEWKKLLSLTKRIA